MIWLVGGLLGYSRITALGYAALLKEEFSCNRISKEG